MFETCTSDDSVSELVLTYYCESFSWMRTLINHMQEKEQQPLRGEERAVVELAQKYECPEILSAIELSLYRAVMSRQSCSPNHFESPSPWKPSPSADKSSTKWVMKNNYVYSFSSTIDHGHPIKLRLSMNTVRIFCSALPEHFWPLTIPTRGSVIRGWVGLSQRSCMKGCKSHDTSQLDLPS